MAQIYELKLYNEVLLTFALEKRGLEGLVAQIVSIADKRKYLLPPDMELTSAGIVKWLRNRVIPRNRANSDIILKTLGLSPNDTQGIIDVCKGLSLNDSYWIVPQGFDGTFEQYNLYENKFSEILSLVAYTGIG
ncbi:MAG: XRE family transcriptional regulator, partial [Clostridia bacterium]|nr:XRE family transcriptional regulator [Clostridia bacterium]